MNISGNTILITGGGTGIGRGLAEALHARGNKVIIAGRRKHVLDKVVAANPGMAAYAFDANDAAGMKNFADTVAREHPKLNVLMNNAGIMKTENVLAKQDTAVAEETIATNFTWPIRLTLALLPHLVKQAHATIINVSSGLATVPLAYTPTYSATKAAIHSYTDSLRYQLRNTSIEVKELTPPWVATELMAGGSSESRAMPLKDFIAEVMQILEQQPDAKEILVSKVGYLRNAVEEKRYEETLNNLNGMVADLATK